MMYQTSIKGYWSNITIVDELHSITFAGTTKNWHEEIISIAFHILRGIMDVELQSVEPEYHAEDEEQLFVRHTSRHY